MSDLTQIQIARQSLQQAEGWRGRDDYTRRRKAENIAQIRRWLEDHGYSIDAFPVIVKR